MCFNHIPVRSYSFLHSVIGSYATRCVSLSFRTYLCASYVASDASCMFYIHLPMCVLCTPGSVSSLFSDLFKDFGRGILGVV